MTGTACTLHSRISLVAALFCLLIAWPVPADDSLATLLEDYNRYALPAPPKDSRLVVLTKSTGTINGVTQYSHTLSLLSPGTDGHLLMWVGCRSTPLGHEVSSRDVEPKRTVVGNTKPAQLNTSSSGFPTYPDLALAIQCQALGFDELGGALLERSQMGKAHSPFVRRSPRPREDRAALATLAWNYWCNEFSLAKDDRSEIVQHLRELTESPFGLDTSYHKNIVSDMQNTLLASKADPGSVEATVDSLLDLGMEGGWRGRGFASLQSATRRSESYQELRDLGLEAAPILIKHTHDFRLTRCLGRSSRGVWHVRIADVVLELLNGLASEELSYDFLIREGRGKAVDHSHALYWWSEAQEANALEYLLQNALTEDSSGSLRANAHVLHALGSRHPDELVKLFEENVENTDSSYALFEALGASKASKESKARLLLSTVHSEDSWKRDFSLRQLLQMKHPEAVSLLVQELDRIPETPKEAYWTSSAGRFSQLVCSTDDERAWKALLRNAKRVDIGQRLEMIQAVGGRSGRKDERVIQFLSDFLDDEELRVIPNRIPDLTNTRNPENVIQATISNLFHGPSAGFTFKRLEVRDFAALQLAYKLDLSIKADGSWNEEDWAELRRKVDETLAKRGGSPEKDKDQ